MPRVSKKAAAETAAETKEIKAVEAAPAEEKKAPAKKTAAKKTTAAKKPAAKKAAAKPAEKKAAKTEENVIIQNYGKEVTASALIAKAKAVSGVKSPKKVDVYVRAEINKVYYVIDGDQFGEFDLID